MSLTKATYSMIEGAPINVVDFGADNTGAIDSTAAINNAIQYAKTNGFGVVVFAPGSYTVSGKLDVKGNFGTGILLEGNNCTITSTADTSVFSVNAALPEPAPQYRINAAFQNFKVIGKGKAYTSAVGFEIVDSAQVRLTNCVIQSCYRGLYGVGCLISDFSQLYISDCYYGVQFEKSVSFAPNDIHLSYCKIYNNTIGIRHVDFTQGSATYIGCEIEGNNLSGNTTDGIRVTEFFDAGKVSLIGCHFELNPGEYNIFYSSSGSGCGLSVIGCEIIPGDSCGTVLKLSNASGATSLFVTESRVTNNVGTAQISVDATCSAVIIGDTAGYVSGSNITKLINGDYAANSIWKMNIGGAGGDVILYGNRTGDKSIEPGFTGIQDLGSGLKRWNSVYSNQMVLADGITAPTTISGSAVIYVDAADGDLKIKFSDGIVKTIVTDT